jgi:undecaprenyl-diphosphatase
MMNTHKLLTSSFGLGFLPIAPGTWGALAPAIVYMAAGILIGPQAAMGSMAALLVLGCVVTVACSPKVIAMTGSQDPGQIVSDEVAGQALTLLLVQWLMPMSGFCTAAAVGFGLFRLFDIFKPWPCKHLENLPAGWGILADDLAAGLWAGGIWMAGRYLGQHIAPAGEQVISLTTGVAVFLGIVQGLTEFLPVSSEGHLTLLQHFLPGLNAESPQMILLDLCLHLGTVLSIFVVFRKTIMRFVTALIKSLGSGLTPMEMYRRKAPVRLAVLAIIASAATVILYILCKKQLESSRGLFGLGFWWLVSAAFLYLADKRKGHTGLRQFGAVSAGLIGLAQGLAILPSVSRSGATISTAMLLGIKPQWAVEFSFLIAIPAILGGAAMELVKKYEFIKNGQLPIVPILAGILAAFVIGVVALKVLIHISRKRKLKVFGFYCLVIAIIVFISLL